MTLAERIGRLPMDEPPAAGTAVEARAVAAELDRRAAELDGEAAALASACARVLEAAAGRRVLMVYAVPLAVAAVELLERPRPGGEAGDSWDRGLAGARYDIETLLPGPIRPDVGLDALRRGPGSGRRG